MPLEYLTKTVCTCKRRKPYLFSLKANSGSSSDASIWLDNVACAIVDVFQVNFLKENVENLLP